MRLLCHHETFYWIILLFMLNVRCSGSGWVGETEIICKTPSKITQCIDIVMQKGWKQVHILNIHNHKIYNHIKTINAITTDVTARRSKLNSLHRDYFETQYAVACHSRLSCNYITRMRCTCPYFQTRSVCTGAP